MSGKDLADLTAFSYGILNTSTKYEVNGLIKGGKSFEFNPTIIELFTGDTPSGVATYAVTRKDGASLPSLVSIATAEVLVYEGVDVGRVRMIYPQMINTTLGVTAVSVAGLYENGAITTTGPALTGVSVDATTGVLTVSGVSDVHIMFM